MNAWPAMHQVLLDGWLLRFSGGFTKRANSIIPLYPSLKPNLEKVRYCENLYAREKLRTIFRLTSVGDENELDTMLAGRGYQLIDPTWVMSRSLVDPVAAAEDFSILPLRDWLRAYCQLSGMPDTAARLHAVLLKSIHTDAVFGALIEDGEVLACGLAVIEQELVGLFDVVTDAARRRRGLGAQIVDSLLHSGREQGASVAYLQVMQDNEPARSLYAKLGFSKTYRYWYRGPSDPPT